MPPDSRDLLRLIDQRIERAMARRRLGMVRAGVTGDEPGEGYLAVTVQALSDGATTEQSRPSRLIQQYGFASRPLIGAEALLAPVGDRSGQGVVLGLEDSRYRPELESGEVTLFDHLGNRVHLTKDGYILIDAIVDLILNGGTLQVARATDPVGAATSMAAWIAAVTAALATLGQVVTPPADFGTITSGAARVKA